MDRRTLTLSPPALAADQLGFFRWGRVGGQVLITNDAADWTFLGEADFADLLAGAIGEGHARFQELQAKGFLREGLDLDGLAARVAQRSRHLRRGPYLHAITLTRRRSPQAPAEPGADLDPRTAEQIVDLALQSHSPSITFELQADGGEPLLNFAVLRHLVEFARTRNQRDLGKTLGFRLLSNFTAMSEEAAEWLIANDVLVRTSLDGPAELHDWTRTWRGGARHADVIRWIEYFNRRYAELGRDAGLWHVHGLSTTSRRTLGAWRELVDEYVARGMGTVTLRPLEQACVDPRTWAEVGYSAEEYLAFYRRALDYILELNRRGVDIVEGTALMFLMRIFTVDDPGIVDVQSPSGEGTNGLAYDVDGRVYPCDDARAIAARGDAMFELGHAGALGVPDLLRHSTVRAIAAASLLDAQPKCADCWNKPFCGFSPVRNFLTQGDLFGQRAHCLQCTDHLAVSTRLFELLGGEGGAETGEVLKRWATNRSPLAFDGRTLVEAP